MKYHFLYKSTCGITNKFYYGMHSTNNINDGYIGNGIYGNYGFYENNKFHKHVKKYGYENFKREIISFHDNRKDLIKAESVLINKDILKSKNILNSRIGGISPPILFGKSNGNYNNKWSDEKKKNLSKIRIKNGFSSGILNSNIKTTFIYNLFTKEILKFEYRRMASMHLSLSKDTISNSISKNRLINYHLICYSGKNEFIKIISNNRLYLDIIFSLKRNIKYEGILSDHEKIIFTKIKNIKLKYDENNQDK